jgi:hypothetical protein
VIGHHKAADSRCKSQPEPGAPAQGLKAA